MTAQPPVSPRSRRRGPLTRITNAAAGVVDVNNIVERVDVNDVVQRIDVNDLANRLDIAALLDRVEPDDLLDRVDINRLLDRVDPDRLLDRVDPDRLLDRVDPDRLLDRVDPDRLLDRVDPDRLLDRVEPDRLLDRVDPDRLLDRVEPDRLLDRVDPDRLIDRVDVDRVMARVDIPDLVARARVAEIVGEGTGQVAGSLLDVVRRQVVAIDEIVGRIAHRVARKDPNTVPEGPELLVSRPDGAMVADRKGRGVIQGHYAGPVSRLIAFLLDAVFVLAVYTGTSAALLWFLQAILRIDRPDWSFAPLLGVAALVLWAFSYEFISLALVGRTIGKGVVGLIVLSADGTALTGGSAFLRTLTKPLSFLFFGLGLLGILFGRNRQALHDKIARTIVVYDWGEREAALPAPLTQWIVRHAD